MALAYDASSLPRIDRGEIGGIPVLFTDEPPPLTAALLFRVGRCDETLPTSGITHLVEHLAIFGAGEIPFQHNGYVDLSTTGFWAQGTTDEVSDYLQRIARSLVDLPLERLGTEKRILRTEEANAGGSLGDSLLRMLTGARSYGLAGCLELGLNRLGESDVRAWARERFTCENAVLWATGPLPGNLALPLSRGPRFPPPEVTTIPNLELPCVAESDPPTVVVAGLGADDASLAAALRTVERRAARRLRRELGVSYSARTWYTALDGRSAYAYIYADTLEERAHEAAETLLGIVDDLALDGPSQAELDESLADVIRHWSDPGARSSHVASAAWDELAGMPRLEAEAVIEAASSVRPDQAAEALAGVLERSITMLPQNARSARRDLPDYKLREPDPVTGTSYRTRGLAARRHRVRLIVGADGITYENRRSGDVSTVRFESCAAVLHDADGGMFLADDDGSEFNLFPGTWERRSEIVRAVEERLPAELFIPLGDDRDEQWRAQAALLVERVAVAKLSRRWLVSEELERLPSELEDGEDLLTMAEASNGSKTGLLALTDRRILFLYDGVRTSADETIVCQLDGVQAVDVGRSFRWPTLAIRTADGEIKFEGIVPKERGEELARLIADRAA